VTADGNPESIQTPHPCKKAVKDNSRQVTVK